MPASYLHQNDHRMTYVNVSYETNQKWVWDRSQELRIVVLNPRNCRYYCIWVSMPSAQNNKA